jgi:putative ABC transport system substrate-binding protein
LATWPLAARAQQGGLIRRIGVLLPHAESDPEAQVRVTAFRQALQTLGWTDGGNIRIDSRFAAGSADRIQAYVAELVGLAPDVMLIDSTPVLSALQRATHTLPVVFVQVSEPVADGFVSSLARPGSNMTGFANCESAIAGKWLCLLKEIAPKVTRVAVIYDPALPQSAVQLFSIESGALSFGIELSRSAVPPRRSPAACCRWTD